jgi:hypothetical protein
MHLYRKLSMGWVVPDKDHDIEHVTFFEISVSHPFKPLQQITTLITKAVELNRSEPPSDEHSRGDCVHMLCHPKLIRS